jgi:hypothetical protein
MSALIILWSQVQVLVGPPEIKIPTLRLVFLLIGFLYLSDNS